MRMRIVCLGCFALVFGLVAVSAGPAVLPAQAIAPGDELLEAKDAFTLIQKNKNNVDFVVLDVRTPEEFKDGHIEGAININYNSGGFRTELLELDRKKTYFVYCRTGRRSAEAVKIMRDLGFTNIIRMKGDILKWQSANLPLVK
jgi:rhodanese-related sulfurtransferase